MDDQMIPESAPAITELDYDSNLILGLIGAAFVLMPFFDADMR